MEFLFPAFTATAKQKVIEDIRDYFRKNFTQS
jgi:superfamily II DNA helicase RecQ